MLPLALLYCIDQFDLRARGILDDRCLLSDRKKEGERVNTDHNRVLVAKGER